MVSNPNFQKKKTADFRKRGLYTEIHCMSLKIILDKFKGADSKYNVSFFKILAQKYPNKTFSWL